MKKFLKCMAVIFLIISIILVLIIIIPIIRIIFFGMIVGSNEYPDSIWWGERTLKGLSGVKTYYSNDMFLMVDLPILFISIIYQIIYFKIIRKRK